MKPLLLVAAILSSIAGSAIAQDLHGSITGKVVDPQQAVIPAVTVVVAHAETGAVNRTQTNRDGYFEVNLLNPGHYSVTLEAAGFKKLTRTGLDPFLMASLAAGMSYTGNPKDTKPFDNSAISAFQSNGGVGQNEYTIDGAPATGTGRQVGFAPSSDAVEEFKLQTTSFDGTWGILRRPSST
jgi:hypothetical protein